MESVHKSEIAILTLPNGKVVELPVYTPRGGGPDCIDIRGLQNHGYFTYDPGFTSTASCSSEITYIDGPKGILLHRGYRIEDLCEHCNYLEVCYLLLNGDLPTADKLAEFSSAIVHHMMLHEKLRAFFTGFKDGAHPMAIMVGVVGSLSAFYSSQNTLESHALTTLRVIAKLPTIAAMAYKHSIGQPYVYPRKDLCFAENFLNMMFSTPCEKYCPPKCFVKAIDLIFLIHADHEQNASTTTVRIAGSSDANPLACISAGIASLWGPMHGGANEAAVQMLREIGTVDMVPEFLEKVKRKECLLFGFGHRIYRNADPRARQMKRLCDEVLNALGSGCDPCIRPLLEVAIALEKAALQEEYFTSRKLYPNVDFYSGLTLTAIGIPISMFTVIFACGRSSGWVAQWKESVEEQHRKISRPRQMYIGEKERNFVPIHERVPLCDEDFISSALANLRSASSTEGVAHQRLRSNSTLP